MISVMIVDDELLVRIGLKQSINWNALGYDVVEEASNGKEALDKIIINPPQLIFLDIKMPGMNGLELLEELRKRNIYTNIIILSCHDEFEYARKAIQLGALDYVLKLSLKPSDLSDMLIELRDKLSSKKAGDESSRQDFIHSNNFPLEKIVQLEEGKTDCLDFNEYNLKFLIISIKPQSDSFFFEEKRKVMFEVLHQVVKHQYYLSIESIGNNIVIMLQIKDEKTVDKDNIINISYRIKNTLTMCFNTNFYIGISSIEDNYENLCGLYEQSLKARSFNFYNIDKVYFYDDIVSTMNIEKYFSDENMKEIEMNLYLDKYDETIEIVEDFFNSIEQDISVYPESLKSFVVEIINNFTRILKAGSVREEKIKECVEKIYKDVFEADNIILLKDLVIDFIHNCFGYMKSQNKRQYKSEYIQKIKDYVHENYKEEISLHVMAKRFNLNESYLSNLFKKETGLNFTEYLNGFRIQKALELLSTKDIKVFEVANRVGYNNVSYFSRLFKKTTGISPNQVKKTQK